MATVTSLGSGSGIDLEGLLTKLMDAERTPLTNLQNQGTSYNTTISALGSLNASLSTLQTAANALVPKIGQSALNNFASYTTTVADTTIATASSSTGAVAGNYSLVVSQLAQGQSYVSVPSADPSSPLTPNTGDTLSFSFPGSATPKVITAPNNTMAGLRDAINNANMGISATVVNGTNGAQLILTGATGTANTFTVSGSGNLATAFPSGLTPATQAQDAQFSINGINATSASNTATSALDGVSLNLTKTGSTTIAVTTDNTTNLTATLNTFITAYNNANTLMKSQGAYNQTTTVAGVLQGNSTLRGAQQLLRGLVFGTAAGGTSAYQRLSDIGVSVSTALDGTLQLDSTKLNAAIAKDPNAVANVISAVGTAYSKKLDSIIGVSGSIQNATNSANKLLKTLTDRESVLQTHLTAIEAQYRANFTALDTLIAGMKQTSAYLTQQLASLPGAASTSK